MKDNQFYKGVVILFLMLTCSVVEADAFSLLKPRAITSHEISNVGYYDSSRVKKSEVIDGTTAASKLRAKKSHAVSKQDETKLTIFLGILAMAFIVFFIKIIVDKN